MLFIICSNLPDDFSDLFNKYHETTFTVNNDNDTYNFDTIYFSELLFSRDNNDNDNTYYDNINDVNNGIFNLNKINCNHKLSSLSCDSGKFYNSNDIIPKSKLKSKSIINTTFKNIMFNYKKNNAEKKYQSTQVVIINLLNFKQSINKHILFTLFSMLYKNPMSMPLCDGKINLPFLDGYINSFETVKLATGTIDYNVSYTQPIVKLKEFNYSFKSFKNFLRYKFALYHLFLIRHKSIRFKGKSHFVFWIDDLVRYIADFLYPLE